MANWGVLIGLGAKRARYLIGLALRLSKSQSQFSKLRISTQFGFRFCEARTIWNKMADYKMNNVFKPEFFKKKSSENSAEANHGDVSIANPGAKPVHVFKGEFGTYSVRVICPHCNQNVKTKTNKKTANTAWILCCLMAFSG